MQITPLLCIHLYTRMQDTAEGMPKKVPQNWTSKQWMSKKNCSALLNCLLGSNNQHYDEANKILLHNLSLKIWINEPLQVSAS